MGATLKRPLRRSHPIRHSAFDIRLRESYEAASAARYGTIVFRSVPLWLSRSARSAVGEGGGLAACPSAPLAQQRQHTLPRTRRAARTPRAGVRHRTERRPHGTRITRDIPPSLPVGGACGGIRPPGRPMGGGGTGQGDRGRKSGGCAVRVPRRFPYGLASCAVTTIADLNRSAIMLRAQAPARSRRLDAAPGVPFEDRSGVGP